MARIDTLPNFLKDVADAIRVGTKSSALIPHVDFDIQIKSLWGKNDNIPMDGLQKVSGSETEFGQLQVGGFIPKVDAVADGGTHMFGFVVASRELTKYTYAPHSLVSRTAVLSTQLDNTAFRTIRANAQYVFIIYQRAISVFNVSDLSFVSKVDLPSAGFECFSFSEWNGKMYMCWGTATNNGGVIVFDMSTLAVTNYQLPAGARVIQNVSVNANGVFMAVSNPSAIVQYSFDLTSKIAEISATSIAGTAPYNLVADTSGVSNNVMAWGNLSTPSALEISTTPTGMTTLYTTNGGIATTQNRNQIWVSLKAVNGTDSIALDVTGQKVRVFNRNVASGFQSNANYLNSAVSKDGIGFWSRFDAGIVFNKKTMTTTAGTNTVSISGPLSSMNASSSTVYTTPQAYDVLMLLSAGNTLIVDLSAQTITTYTGMVTGQIITFDRTHVFMKNGITLYKYALSDLSTPVATWAWEDPDGYDQGYTPYDIIVFPSMTAQQLVVMYAWDSYTYGGAVLDTIRMSDMSRSSSSRTYWMPYYGSPSEGMFYGQDSGVQGAVYDGSYWYVYNWGYFNQQYDYMAYGPRRFIWGANTIIVPLNDSYTYTDVSADYNNTYNKKSYLVADAFGNLVRTTDNRLIDWWTDVVISDSVMRTVYTNTPNLRSYFFDTNGFFRLYNIGMNAMRILYLRA